LFALETGSGPGGIDMGASLAGTQDGAGDSPRRLELLFVAILAVWLGGFWYCSGAWWHRWGLGCLVIPALLLNFGQLRSVVREERWLRLAAVLLVWQVLSRFWSSGPPEPMGSWIDALLVFGLLCSVFVLARGPLGTTWVFPALAVVAALVALLSLLVFYAHPERSVAESRLRNVLIYEHGLNAVLTGLLCAFGALIAAWKVAGTDPAESKPWRWFWLAVLVLNLLGLLASQSRGPMLMYGVGVLVFVGIERRRIIPAVVASVLTVLSYFGLLAWATAGQEAAIDLIQRGSTGRLEMYGWFFKQMSGWEGLFGKGMATTATVAEEEFGWFIQHPHSSYLTQFYLTGLVGTALLGVLLAWGLQAALKLALSGESLWLALLAGAGVALLIDGGHAFSVFSVARLEILLLAVPAAMAVGRVRGREAG
jgi:hypothetical protein